MFDFRCKCTFDQMEYNLGRENAHMGLIVRKILGRIDEDAPYEGRALNCLDKQI